MKLSPQAKFVLLILGDVFALYASLFLVLYFRYPDALPEAGRQHFLPMTIVFAIWLAVFYILGLYDFRNLRDNFGFLKNLASALAVNFTIAILFFYLLPVWDIAPKTNLLFFLLVFGIVEFVWRPYLNRHLYSRTPAVRVALIGQSPAAEEISRFLSENPEFGYKIELQIREIKGDEDWQTLIPKAGADLIIVPRQLLKEPRVVKNFFRLLNMGVEIKEASEMYEAIFRRVPLSEIDEEWFLEHAANPRPFYEKTKRLLEWLLALVLFLILLPLQIFLALLIKLTSPGPAIYKQVRVGQRGKNFILYKFRTMRKDAERDGPRWSEVKDPRSTPVGQALRLSHLDELPQLWNILKGDLSFVGPRPERPEFVVKLKNEVPYYETRLLVRPGFTGWAQIHRPKDQSIEDVEKKMEYDLFYLKNRSLILDLAIFLKTLKMLFANPK
jgi:exopolysaccharide biosynthesis polyprenyl glycosylphosphotransferase